MSWRTVCISQRAKLELHMGALVVRGQDVKRIHLSEIAVLLIESTAVSLTAALIVELIRQKIKVIFCDEQHNPICELFPYYGSHDSTDCIRRQLAWSAEIKSSVWTLIIQDKIKKQAEQLEASGLQECELLYRYVNEVVQGDTTNREGHAAKVYFNALFGKDFSRDDANPINAALDYGYSLLLSSFNKEIAGCGRLSQLGVWHDNRFNHFNLSSDLMESFRPLVDRMVCGMTFGSDELTQEMKHELLTLLELKVLINGQNQYLTNAIKIYVQKILQVLDQNDLSAFPVLSYV